MKNSTIDNVEQNQKINYPFKELLKLSLEERANILRPIINQIAEDVNNDPEFNLFSHLDGEGQDSARNVLQIRSISTQRFIKKIGILSSDIMSDILASLMISVDYF